MCPDRRRKDERHSKLKLRSKIWFVDCNSSRRLSRGVTYYEWAKYGKSLTEKDVQDVIDYLHSRRLILAADA